MSSSETVSDASLLRRFRGGDEEAAAQLYHRYAQRLQGLATRQCSPGLAQRVGAEEIVQSVFRTFFRRAAQGEYYLAAGEELWKLMLVIALHKIRAVGAFHTAAKRDVRQTVGGDALAGAAALDEDREAFSALKMMIEELLGQLPESSRRIVELRIQGFEVAEIAAQTARAKRSVERVLQEFRKTLARVVEDDAS